MWTRVVQLLMLIAPHTIILHTGAVWCLRMVAGSTWWPRLLCTLSLIVSVNAEAWLVDEDNIVPFMTRPISHDDGQEQGAALIEDCRTCKSASASVHITIHVGIGTSTFPIRLVGCQLLNIVMLCMVVYVFRGLSACSCTTVMIHILFLQPLSLNSPYCCYILLRFFCNRV